MKKEKENPLVSTTDEVLTEVEKVVEDTEQKINSRVKPIRESVIKRFPSLFLLLVTFGVTSTLTGMEQFLIKYELLYEHPSIMVILGIGILVLTGTLYKKLG